MSSRTWQQRQLVTSLLLALSLYLSCKTQLQAQAQTSEDTSNNYPDPIALLDGVVAARASIPPSSLKLEFVRSDSVSTHKKIIQVDFDQEHRHYYYYPENPGKPILTVADEKIVPDQGVYDGQQVVAYDPSDSVFAEIMHITDQSGQPLFDPRILGVNDLQADSSVTSFMWQKIRDRLRSVEIKGRERIGDRDAWHVQVVMSGGYPVDYWIDPDRDFQVLRYSHGTLPLHKMTSVYENDKYPWLPSKVISERPRIGAVTTITMIEAEVKEPFPENHWTIEGIDLPRGTEVYSHLESKSLGYWDGEKISKEFVPRDRKPSRKTQWTFILSLAVLITVIFWIGMLKKQKKQP